MAGCADCGRSDYNELQARLGALRRPSALKTGGQVRVQGSGSKGYGVVQPAQRLRDRQAGKGPRLRVQGLWCSPTFQRLQEAVCSGLRVEGVTQRVQRPQGRQLDACALRRPPCSAPLSSTWPSTHSAVQEVRHSPWQQSLLRDMRLRGVVKGSAESAGTCVAQELRGAMVDLCGSQDLQGWCAGLMRGARPLLALQST